MNKGLNLAGNGADLVMVGKGRLQNASQENLFTKDSRNIRDNEPRGLKVEHLSMQKRRALGN